MYIIITGPKGAGKSVHLLMLTELLKKQGKTVGGVISRGFWKGKEREGYEIVNPSTGFSRLLCAREKPIDADPKDILGFCSYFFLKSAFAEGNQWIAHGLGADILCVDEVGTIEITGIGGWDVKRTIPCKQPVILSVREDAVPKLESVWGITGPVIPISPGVNSVDAILTLLNSYLVSVKNNALSKKEY